MSLPSRTTSRSCGFLFVAIQASQQFVVIFLKKFNYISVWTMVGQRVGQAICSNTHDGHL